MSQIAKIRVMIVDDHDLLRRGIGICLRTAGDIEVVGGASNGVEALKQSDLLRLDVILMDLLLPQMDGIVVTRIIHQKHPAIRILIFTIFEDQQLIQAAMDSGAVGYVLKNVLVGELAAAIRQVYKAMRI